VQNRPPKPYQDLKETQEIKLELKGFISEAQKLTEQLDPIVDNYEGRSSEFLAGALGGVGGGGYIIGLWSLGYMKTVQIKVL